MSDPSTEPVIDIEKISAMRPDELRRLADELEREIVLAASRSPDANRLIGRRMGLTDREMDVLTCLADGHTYLHCAKVLSLSHATVKTHISGLYSKLRARDRGHAVSIAFRLGILE